MSRKKTPDELSSEGKKCLEKGDFRTAERLFARALAAEDHPSHRNNLATALFYAGELERALAVLEPYLKDGDPLKVNPYSYALASRIHSARGEREKARARLTEAVQKYEELRSAARGRLSPLEERNIREYTVIIMHAAADLEDHRLVFELYRRWEMEHISYQNKHLAAVACFNLGRYKRAASLWASIGHVHDIYSHLQGIALLVEQGTIPPFTLAYDLPKPEEVIRLLKVKSSAAPEEWEHLLMHSHVCLFSLLMLLQKEIPAENTYAAYYLVFYGGEWGRKLGFSILNSPVFSTEAKMGAAQALMARGILKEGDPVPMYVDGERRLVQLVTSEAVLHYDQKLDELVRRAEALRKTGKLDEAVELLEDLWVKKKKLYPPALLELAECLCYQGKHQEARRVMDMLKDILPDNPIILYNSCTLHLQMGNAAAAREDLEALKELDGKTLAELGANYRKQLDLLETKVELVEKFELLSDPSIIESVVEYFAEKKRHEVEEKPLSIDATLSRVLKNMPVHWLEAALLTYGIEPARLRREKERQLKEFLSNRENLVRVIQALEEKEKELLKYLLERGGFSRLNVVTRKFGSMEGDGFFWNEKPPSSPLGVLWSRALVIVGRAVLGGRNCRVAVVPADLRPLLREILALHAGPAILSEST